MKQPRNHAAAASWIIVGAAAIASAGCNNPKSSNDSENVSKAVKVEKIGRVDMSEVFVYSVDLESSNEVKVYSLLSNYVLEFPWEEGDEIEQGQILAHIRKGALRQNMAQVSAQIEGLDAQIAALNTQLERSKKLLKDKVMSQQSYDELETSYLSLLAQRKALKAGKGQLAVSVSDSKIKAPIGGVIANKTTKRGDLASPQVPLCTIMSVDTLKVNLELAESHVSKIRKGQDVIIHLDAYPDRVFKGKLTRVLPYLDAATRTNHAEITLPNPVDEETGRRLLKPGMFGYAEIVVSERREVLAAPEKALLMDSDLLERQKPGEALRKAFVVDGKEEASERIVKVGTRKNSLYEVISGLEEGEKIVVRGQHGLKDGQRVEIAGAK